jgi:hypothetical protein
MLTHIRRIVIIVLPAVAAGVLLAFFGQPKETKTVEVGFEPPQTGVDILHTTGIGCESELSLAEFGQTHSAMILLVDSDLTGDFNLFVVANDSANTCVKAKIVSIDPTICGQVVEGYEIDVDEGLLKIEVRSKFSDGDGVDYLGFLNPIILHLYVGISSVFWILITWSAQYTKFWKSLVNPK